ncbi:hypothetical protein BSKO_06520 [Bryopsis sp. KO-2023]|nr:hypothetical protein BSKO_06520 [Bryopsis sp. KO-2023]
MVSGGGLAGLRMSAGMKAARGGGRGLGVPMDLYGHTPTEVTQFKTWTGFMFSLVVIIVVSASVGYVVYEYVTLPYDLAESQGLYDSELLLGPDTEVPVPEFGVQVVTSNQTLLNVSQYPEVVDIFFWQNFILGDGLGGPCPGHFKGKRCRKRVRIPSERCIFHGELEDDVKVDAFCPMWGYLNEYTDENGALQIDFVPTSNRTNATVPAIQAQFMDELYAFVEAEVNVNLTGLELRGSELELNLSHIFGGQIAYLCAYTRHVLFDIGINDIVPKKFVRWSQAVEIKEYLSSKVDIPLKTREVGKGNFIVDFDFLESEYQDVIVGNVAQELDDAEYIPSLFALQNSTGNLPLLFREETGVYENQTEPETLKLSKAFFHIDSDAALFKMTPPSTIFDILGLVGGFLSLFSLLIGWPAMIINQMMFSHALKRAMRSGKVPPEYLDKGGAVKVDKANEVLEQLNSLDSRSGFRLIKWRRWRKKKSSRSISSKTESVQAAAAVDEGTSSA